MSKTLIAIALALAATVPARAAEIHVLSAAVMQTVFKDVGGEFERASGHKLVFDYRTMGAITERVLNRRGERGGGEISRCGAPRGDADLRPRRVLAYDQDHRKAEAFASAASRELDIAVAAIADPGAAVAWSESLRAPSSFIDCAN